MTVYRRVDAAMVRRADPERDAAACAAIYAPYVSHGVASFEEVPPAADEMRRRIEAYLATHEWLVADDGGDVAGFAYACPNRERAAYRWAVDVSVYVSASHQRRGVGRALYEELLARLERRGFRTACAGITLPNEASVALHEAFGFELVGVYRKIGFKFGAWHDVGWWQRPLGANGATPPTELLPPTNAR